MNLRRGVVAPLVFVSLVSILPIAEAADCSTLQGIQAVADALESTDPVARARAESCGLASDDRATRGLVIRHYLRKSSTIAVSIENMDGDAAGAEFLPNMPAFVATEVVWSPDGNSFQSDNNVTGQLIGETLSMTFEQADLSTGSGYVQMACETSLKLNPRRDALDGILRCQGVVPRFHAWLGL